jgi:hypothetical protein
MIQPLRKIHRRGLVLLAVALPAIFVAGVRARHRLPGRIAARVGNSVSPGSAKQSASAPARTQTGATP